MADTVGISEQLKQLRSEAGMSQQALAMAAGLSMSVVSQIEQGQKADPRISTVKALAQALGVPIDELARDVHTDAREAVEAAEDLEPPKGKKGKAADQAGKKRKGKG